MRPLRGSASPGRLRLLIALLPLVAGCAARQVGPPAPSWTGAPASIPRGDRGAYFAPQTALQFLVDPYPEPEGPSWLGADVATSIRVTRDRYIWIFGDTLLGSVSDRCPGGQVYCDRKVERGTMIRNSVGVAERADDDSFRRVVKHWPVDGGESESFFPAEAEDEFLWPLAGVRAGPVVLITANHHTDASGLAPVGNTLLRIANPEDDPGRWEVTHHELPNFRAFDGPEPSLVWTMAIVHLGRYVYIFGELGSAFDARTVLARVAASEVSTPGWKPAPEYLMRDEAGDLRWSRDFDVTRLHTVRGLPGTSETTVDHDPELGWYSYQLPPLGFDIRLYTAPDLEGPWRDSGVVYDIPPPWSTERHANCDATSLTCNTYIAYAVKAHPELAPEGGRVLSYNVNLGSGSLFDAEIAADETPGFYVPHMIVGPNGAPAD